MLLRLNKQMHKVTTLTTIAILKQDLPYSQKIPNHYPKPKSFVNIKSK